jgi:O-antigen/teichoic acid export membrane protein
MLYASKSGAIIVGLFILPWYARLLGPEAFGIVALILSLQAFLLLLDLGMSTVVGRDIAASQNNQENYNNCLAAELLLLMAHAMLLMLAVVLYIFFSPPFSIFQVVSCIIFFGALTINNLGHSVLLSKRQFVFSGALQVVGVLGRAFITIGTLLYIRADLNTFLVTQTLASLVQAIITSWLCKKIINPPNKSFDFYKAKSHILKLARRGSPLILFGISGAAAMQLD